MLRTGVDLKTHKKTRFPKKLYLLLIILAAVSVVVIVVFALLLHKPSYYKPLDYSNSREISVYLTNQLLPDFYNGVQLQEPFHKYRPHQNYSILRKKHHR